LGRKSNATIKEFSLRRETPDTSVKDHGYPEDIIHNAKHKTKNKISTTNKSSQGMFKPSTKGK
jgi:hypothetical protein